MQKVIRINDKKEIRLTSDDRMSHGIVTVENILKGSTTWHILFDSREISFEQAVAEIETAGLASFAGAHDLARYNGKP